ncbi:lysylphosphatidylglycerol synthase transmembrane domain-containing protein [Lipingzhangella sp. LS1_29]|uniref:Lysylphosphatidylglycerol synthase transmembrane domain-containing protein n=1 Tax=Lipingzhangella rawalii TaxID=2055835 RepID=A0ABU2H7J9_9ACTN|nr:lysylphosphatidylglycerol synthase transmembrane domain-containing protein [Lipingzhangella rawalii]MDS1271289.1 lysylphosphatidylglycerol synthase transmembrane domain-containing protein [Lipingzhangella rawalii]
MPNRLRPWVRLAMAAALLGMLGLHLGAESFASGVSAVRPDTVGTALAAGLVWTGCNAARWRLVARQLGVELPWSAALADTYRAQFVNAVLPSGVLGDVHRAWCHGRQVGDLGRGTRIVVLERVSGQLVLIGASLVALAGYPRLFGEAARELGVVPGVALVLAAGLAAGVALAGWLRPRSWLRRAVTAVWREVRTGLLPVWLGIVALSTGALGAYLALFLVATRSTGTTAPLGVLVPLLLVALVAMALPVNVGGWGPREVAAAGTFAMVGLGAADGLSAAVAYGVLTTIALLPGAAVVLIRTHVRVAVPRPRRGPVGGTSAGRSQGAGSEPPDPVHQAPRPGPAAPGEKQEQHQQCSGLGRENRAVLKHEQIRGGGADHNPSQCECGDPGQSGQKQAYGTGELHNSGDVAEPLSQPDLVEQHDLGGGPEKLIRSHEGEISRQEDLRPPQGDVHATTALGNGGPLVRGHVAPSRTERDDVEVYRGRATTATVE